MCAGEALGEPMRRFVLANVARLEARRDDAVDARRGAARGGARW